MICPACNTKYDDDLTFCPKDGTALIPDDAQTESRVGQILADRYRIVRMLGEGGMGEVYEAEHIYIKKKVALKLLRSEITSNAEAVTRFHQEALAASTIGHENIVIIDDFGRLPDGSVYLTMEFLDGEPLSDLMLKGPIGPPRALDLVIQICRGLAAAHSKGIIHRDMKPENVYLVDHEGREIAKILDFGIAKVNTADSGQNLTRTGTIFGTPHYMSPEQAMGRSLDHRTDIYSVGVIMYELFTGVVPFKAESFMGILTQHITALPTPPRNCAPDRQIHPEIERIILTAMAKEPERRYPSMVEFLEDLRNVKRTVTTFQPAVAPAGAPIMGGWGPGSTAVHPTAATQPSGQMQTPGPLPTPGQVSGPVPAAVQVVRGDPSQPSMPAMPAAHVTGPTAAAPAKKSSGAIIAMIAVIVVLLGGGGAAAFFLLQKGDSDDGEKKKDKVAAADSMDAMEEAMDAMDSMDAMDAMSAMDNSGEPGMEVALMKAGDAMDGSSDISMQLSALDMAPMEAGKAEPVHILVKTRKRGAQIYRGLRRLCKTPCKVEVPADGSVDITLKQRRYEDKSVTLRADGPKTVNVTMTRIRSGHVSVMHVAAMRPPPMIDRPPPMRRRRPPMRRMSADPFSEGID